MQTGIVFDIQEFCVHDGPGPRVTVFFKGCPLRCRWCHNPEGLSPKHELMRSAACTKCGRCSEAEELLRQEAYESIPSLCPNGFLKVAGKRYTSGELSNMLLPYRQSLSLMGGGITLSGGECLLQSEFASELLKKLSGMHRAIETAGHVPKEDFLHVLPHVELVLFDIKHMDTAIHRQYTGVGNELILENLTLLKQSGVPFIARIPLIPGVNDSEANLARTAQFLMDTPSLIRVELLPYNENAGAKYGMLGKHFSFHPANDTMDRTDAVLLFKRYGIECIVQ